MKMHFLMICVLLLTSACGFHLRGSQTRNLDIDSIYIHNSFAPRLMSEMKSQLTNVDVDLSSSPDKAKYVLFLKKEKFERTILSVDPATGKAEEYQVSYTVSFDMKQSNGNSMIKDEVIRISRDFTFEEDVILGKFSEEEVLQNDMLRQVADQVLRRLQALTVK